MAAIENSGGIGNGRLASLANAQQHSGRATSPSALTIFMATPYGRTTSSSTASSPGTTM